MMTSMTSFFYFCRYLNLQVLKPDFTVNVRNGPSAVLRTKSRLASPAMGL